MNETNINERKLPVASIILSLVACMMAFSGATSYIVDVISYSKIDILPVTYMATYVIMFAATVVLSVGYSMHLRDKTHLVAIGAYILAFCYGVQTTASILNSKIAISDLAEFLAGIVFVGALIVIGLYYATKRPFLGFPFKLIFAILSLAAALISFIFFLINPEGAGDYTASWGMYPFFIFIAFLLYTPFEKEEAVYF